MNRDVTVRVECLMPERLLERAVAQGASFSSARRPDEHTLEAQCDAASAEILLALCRRFSLPGRVVSRRGRSAFIGFARRRATLPLGIALCALLCALFLGRIWRVDIAFSGDAAHLGDRAALAQAVADRGVRPGVPRSLDTALLARQLQAEFRYSYVGAHLQGVRLLVEAVPEVPAPQVYDVEAARDLVADRDGIVVSAVARSGELCVKPGDAVRRGQLLIRGEEQAAREDTRPIAALGEVVVRTWYTGEAQLPLTREAARYTGKTSTGCTLSLMGFSWPVSPWEDFARQTVEIRRLPIGGLFLPLELTRRTCREVSVTPVAQDPAKLEAALAPLALADAAMALARGASGEYELKRTWVDFERAGDRLAAHAVYEIEINAAATRETLLNQ